MEALLFTIGLLVLVIGALALLARSWPRSSRVGGYKAGRGAGHEEQDVRGGDGAPQEDDDAHWDWRDKS